MLSYLTGCSNSFVNIFSSLYSSTAWPWVTISTTVLSLSSVVETLDLTLNPKVKQVNVSAFISFNSSPASFSISLFAFVDISSPFVDIFSNVSFCQNYFNDLDGNNLTLRQVKRTALQ